MVVTCEYKVCSRRIQSSQKGLKVALLLCLPEENVGVSQDAAMHG
jgi:hypothetical protein